jgi:hypothetical protein
MAAGTGSDALRAWSEGNQRHLTAAVRVARCWLGGDAAEALATAEAALQAEALALPAPPALERLCGALGLSVFERALLLLCAGVELDPELAALSARLQNGAGPLPTFAMALSLLPEPHWDALAPERPLRRLRMIEPLGGGLFAQSPLRLDERVLQHLCGLGGLDERLAGLVHPLPPAAELPPSLRALAARCAELWAGAGPQQPPPVLLLVGDDPQAAQAVAAAALAELGLRPWSLAAALLPTGAGELEQVLRLWTREAVLQGAGLLVELEGTEAPDGAHRAGLLRLLEQLPGAVALSGPARLRLRRPGFSLNLPRPQEAEQRALWQQALGEEQVLGESLDELVGQFRLSGETIRSLGQRARATARGALAAEELWELCRAESRPRLSGLAQRIEPVAGFADLVLPEPQLLLLRELAAHVRERTRVYERWGFSGKSSRGLGVSALFHGQSGTGKTMTAEVLAGELRLDLYRIDLSQVVSKWVGETEKQLRRIFDAAEAGGALLLFDEADALFGKRSEVKDSHDRYANIEVSYLLQRMEEFRGLAILTTNQRESLDSAFLRRIRFAVQFPFPDAKERAEVWRRVFPRDAPTAGLDWDKLARLSVPGGNIRNMALYAAFLAAHERQAVQMRHLRRAAQVEFAKLDRALPPAEVADWVASDARVA